MTIHNIFKVEGEDPSQTGDVVSLFSGYENSKPIGAISLSDFLLQPKYKVQVEEIRRCPDKVRRRELKSKLPAVTPSGVFSKRCNTGLVKHSGFLGIDIDGQDNPEISDWEAMKSSVSNLAGLWHAGLSASGNGLFLVFKIKYPQRHSEHFAALTEDLARRGLVVDAACKDIARLRGASYDPKPFHNSSVAPCEGLCSSKIVSKPQAKPEPAPSSADLTTIRVGKLVDAIECYGANIAEFYPDWYAIGRALASEFGEPGRSWFHSVSCQSQKYNPAECNQQYNRCLATCSQTSISTFFWHCKKNGITIQR